MGKKTLKIGLAGLAGIAALGGGIAHFAPRTIEGEIVSVKTPQCARVWDDAYKVDCDLVVEQDSGEDVAVSIEFEGRLPGECQPYSPVGTYIDLSCPNHTPAGAHFGRGSSFDYSAFEQSKDAAEYISINMVEGNRLKIEVVRRSILRNNFSYKHGTGFSAWDTD